MQQQPRNDVLIDRMFAVGMEMDALFEMNVPLIDSNYETAHACIFTMLEGVDNTKERAVMAQGGMLGFLIGVRYAQRFGGGEFLAPPQAEGGPTGEAPDPGEDDSDDSGGG